MAECAPVGRSDAPGDASSSKRCSAIQRIRFFRIDSELRNGLRDDLVLNLAPISQGFRRRNNNPSTINFEKVAQLRARIAPAVAVGTQHFEFTPIGVNMDGRKEVLGLWIAQTEGDKFWLQVVTELKARGVRDIFIACVDGLKGFPEAIEVVYPKASVQPCIVHMARNSLKFVSWKYQREAAADLKLIYRSTTVEMAEQKLTDFEAKWDESYPLISQS